MRIKCTVAYDGWQYAGWQKQENALGIQSVIEGALYTLHKRPISITASGRTDAKVHALGQVFHFDSPENMEPGRYVQALNSLLPQDIRILSSEAADESFHARFSATLKCYEYIATYAKPNPFTYRYKAQLYQKPDLDAMLDGGRFLLGCHDFTSFSSSKIPQEKSRIKTIRKLIIEDTGEDVRFVFEGNGFLRYQVRMMVGTLLEAGKGSLAPEDVKTILDAKDKEACRYNAPAQGLYLVRVDY